jgi:hypothetical protein
MVPESVDVAEALDKAGTGPTFEDKWGDVVPVFIELANEVREIVSGA